MRNIHFVFFIIIFLSVFIIFSSVSTEGTAGDIVVIANPKML